LTHANHMRNIHITVRSFNKVNYEHIKLNQHI